MARPWRTAVVLLVVAAVGAVPLRLALADPSPAEPPPEQAPAVDYRPPVDAPIADPFRPPATPYGPGNRGIEYATAPGTVVRAAAAGTVTFAGLVARSLDVTIFHADGIRTSYVGLATTRVHVGDTVALGEPIATTTDRFHIGARRGDAYVDPAGLWGPAQRGSAYLVPLDGHAHPR